MNEAKGEATLPLLCSKCGVSQPPENYRLSAKMPGGRRKDCGDCEKKRQQERQSRNRLRVPTSLKNRMCRKCTLGKPIEEFYNNKTSDDGWDQYCKECRQFVRKESRNVEAEHAYGRVWRQNNVEKRKQYTVEYRSRPETTLREKEYYEEYRRRPKVLERDRINAHNRRAVTRNILPADTWTVMLKTYGPQCMKCGSDTDLQMDHIVPLSKDGLHEWDNLQILCKDCNLSKGNRNSIDYRILDG